ncbi:MAG: hypothetical protein A2201_02680 [Alicyclobacillus sp. RIFOXYA1_FULL_53_8]|nr:MAG: hypothetical protein A2201_02680 [Alicyclobacillus sp. RIFOXYA1_FULL_53_8]
MKVRFGFVAMAMSLTNASPSQTMTVRQFQALSDRDAALRKLTRIAASNLSNTLRVLRHAHASGIHVYRFSSKLVPLFGHDLTTEWGFLEQLSDDFQQVGHFVKEHRMRVSFHPDHYTVLNSSNEGVFRASVADLLRHVAMLETMGLDDEAKLVLHIGGAYKDKALALERFRQHWGEVPPAVQARLTLENDDKSYTAKDTLKLCQDLALPMVLDVHHDLCNPDANATLRDLLGDIFATWTDTSLVPKVHISSPKSEADLRSHADFVDVESVLPFLNLAREYNQDFDVMLEAKQKDEAVFWLMKNLAKISGVQVLDGATIRFRI